MPSPPAAPVTSTRSPGRIAAFLARVSAVGPSCSTLSRGHVDHDLPRPGDRISHLGDLQHLGPAVLARLNRSHDPRLGGYPSSRIGRKSGDEPRRSA